MAFCSVLILVRFWVGTKRIKQLADNARYFRQGIKKLGFIVYGMGSCGVWGLERAGWAGPPDGRFDQGTTDGRVLGRQRCIADCAGAHLPARQSGVRSGVYAPPPDGNSPHAFCRALGREMKKRGICIVVVGYPATPIVESRVRFCLSASHTRADLDKVLQAMDEVGRCDGRWLLERHVPTDECACSLEISSGSSTLS